MPVPGEMEWLAKNTKALFSAFAVLFRQGAHFFEDIEHSGSVVIAMANANGRVVNRHGCCKQGRWCVGLGQSLGNQFHVFLPDGHFHGRFIPAVRCHHGAAHIEHA